MNGLAPEILAVLNVFDAIVSTPSDVSVLRRYSSRSTSRAMSHALTTPRGLCEGLLRKLRSVVALPYRVRHTHRSSSLCRRLFDFRREPSTSRGSILPAALALIGGLNIYVFGTEAKHKALIAYCVSLFMVVLIYGIQRGTYVREIDREPAELVALTQQEIQEYVHFARIRSRPKSAALALVYGAALTLKFSCVCP